MDLLVMATHSRHGLRWFLEGSVAERVARRWASLLIPAEVPGFVKMATGEGSLRRILVPLDPSEDPQQPLEWVLRLVSHWQGETGEVRLLQIGAAETEGLVLPTEGWTWSREIRSGEVVEEILKEAGEWKADLLVMGTRGHNSVGDSLWGSRTERVLHDAPCAMLILPVQHHESS
jgi:nucleotide-binding universal stress UspA family protein